jgi:hypothetical protein
MILCKGCFDSWPKGLSFGDYCKMPYKSEPIKYPSGLGTAEDCPP